jgi:tripartite-type tricarboxylate transporter receptor subunit TctC
LSEQGADLQGGSVEDFAKFIHDEMTRWGVVVKQANIKAD